MVIEGETSIVTFNIIKHKKKIIAICEISHHAGNNNKNIYFLFAFCRKNKDFSSFPSYAGKSIGCF